MLRKFFSIYFWVTWAALTLASALFLFGTFSAVESTTRFIVLPKQAPFVAAPANIERVLMTPTVQQQVQTAWQGLNSKRPTSFLQMVSALIERPVFTATLEPMTSILEVKAAETDRIKSERLTQLVLTHIASTVSRYYNVETELDIRVIDGPRQNEVVREWPLYIGASLTVGFGVTSLFFLLITGLDYVVATRPRRLPSHSIPPETFRPSIEVPYWSQGYQGQHETLPPVQSPVESEPAGFEATSLEPATVQATYQPETVAVESVFQERESAAQVFENTETKGVEPDAIQAVNEDLVRARGIATGKAPDNLPIMDDLSPLEAANARLVRADIDATARMQAAEAEAVLGNDGASSEAMDAEPTQDEYKRRLNELLSGRL